MLLERPSESARKHEASLVTRKRGGIVGRWLIFISSFPPVADDGCSEEQAEQAGCNRSGCLILGGSGAVLIEAAGLAIAARLIVGDTAYIAILPAVAARRL